jgi:M6 family metalloprotease-like protein
MKMILPYRGGIKVSFFPLSFLVIMPILVYYLSTMKSKKIFSAVIFFLLLSGFYPGPAPADVKMPSIDKRVLPSVGYYQKQSIRKLAEGAIECVDSLNLLVIRVSFQDSGFETDSTEGLPHDFLYFNNELRHLKEYYYGASGGMFNLNYDLLDKIIQMSRPQEYYGEEERWSSRMIEMLIETVDSTDSVVDYSGYDAFALIHSGAGRETDIFGDSPGQLWSGFIGPEEIEEIIADTLAAPGIPTDDSLGGEPFYIDNLLILPEESSQDGYIFGSLGIYAYQLAKRLGLLPLYDSTPSGYSDSQGIGNFGLMSYGLYNALGFVPAFPSAFNRYLMGWVEVVTIDENCLVKLKDINSVSPEDTQMVRVDLSPSEYFLIVNRVHDTDFDGFFDFGDINGDGIPQNRDTLLGAEFDFYMTQETNPSIKVIRDTMEVNKYTTGSGIMIWHVDERVILDALVNDVNMNNNAALKGVDLEEADGIQDLDRSGGAYAFGSYYDSYRNGNNDSFGENTMPSSDGNFGINSGINITDISDTGQSMNFRISFDHSFESETVRINGLIQGHSPIPAEVNSSTGIDMIVTADTGLVYLVSDAGAPEWTDRIELLAEFPGAVWKGPPVVSDIDGGQNPEIFAVSANNTLYGFNCLGDPFTIDADGTPGSLDMPDSILSLPMMIEIDSDTLSEVLILSSAGDSVFINIIGSSAAIEGAHEIGDGVFRVPFAGGSLVSNPSAAAASGSIDGFFCLIRRENGTSELRLVRFVNGAFSTEYCRALSCPVPESSLLLPSSGDIDGDGFDEMIVSVPGSGLIFWSPEGDRLIIYENSNIMSPPALEDIDGDGVLETAARDPKNLFLFTGFGVLKENWPVSIDARVSLLEGCRSEYSQPIIEDIDEDEKCEIIFNIMGNLHAFEIDSNRAEGWPIIGAGGGLETPAFFKGVGNDLRIFMTGRTDLTGNINVNKSGSVMNLSCAVCFNTANRFFPDRGWSFYRHDISGTGRKSASGSFLPAGEIIDGRTFICYPNPVREKNLTVRISISSTADVKICILNIEGEKVLEISRTHPYSSGNNVPFEASVPVDNLASGIYICYMEISADNESWRGARKFAVVK